MEKIKFSVLERKCDFVDLTKKCNFDGKMQFANKFIFDIFML